MKAFVFWGCFQTFKNRILSEKPRMVSYSCIWICEPFANPDGNSHTKLLYVPHTWLLWHYLLTVLVLLLFLTLVLLLLLVLLLQAEDRAKEPQAAPTASALRSGAELAVSKGEHDKALRLYAQVKKQTNKKNTRETKRIVFPTWDR